MLNNAQLRLAVSLAAAITSAVILPRTTADDQGPASVPAAPPPHTATRPAQDPPSTATRRQTYPFRGVIALVDESARTLALEGKQTRRLIRLTPTTRLEKEGRPATFEELKPGESVGGTLRRTANGDEEALLVRVGPRPRDTKPPKKTPAAPKDGDS